MIEEEILKSDKITPTDEEIKELLGIGNKRLDSLKNYINIHSSESLESLEKSDSEYEEEMINELLDDERIEEENRKQILNGIYIDREDIFGEHAIKTDIAAERMVANKDLNEVLDTLTEREKKVLKSRFGLEDGRQKTLEETGEQFYISRERVREIEAKALRKLRRPTRAKKIIEYSKNLGSEEWEKYDGIYENIGDRNQIVDGIKVENYNLNKEKNKKRLRTEIDEKNIEELEDNNVEVTEGKEIEQYQGQFEKIEKIEKYSNEQNYLNEITELLGELNGLNQMLRQTSIKIKSEKNKKQKNNELREKMIKVKGLMQR